MDKNVQKVIEKFTSRAKHGLDKYGVTTERKDLSFFDWLEHLQDELMDATVYVERLKDDVKNMFERVCPDCNSSGMVYSEFWESDIPCGLCKGKGYIYEI